jgi:hypothetical protein
VREPAAILPPVALLLMTVSTASGDLARGAPWVGIPDVKGPIVMCTAVGECWLADWDS